jgi:hypothetical protein
MYVMVCAVHTPGDAVVPTVNCRITQSAKLPAELLAAVSTPVVNVPLTVSGAPLV